MILTQRRAADILVGLRASRAVVGRDHVHVQELERGLVGQRDDRVRRATDRLLVEGDLGATRLDTPDDVRSREARHLSGRHAAEGHPVAAIGCGDAVDVDRARSADTRRRLEE